MIGDLNKIIKFVRMFEDERRYMKINIGIIHIIKLLNQLSGKLIYIVHSILLNGLRETRNQMEESSKYLALIHTSHASRA